MSTAALVLALITAGLSSAYYDECYEDSYDESYGYSYDDSYDDCYDGEFMADPESCCHYYVCDHGRPVRFVCGEGNFYSPDLQTCDHQRNVDCGTRSTEGCGGYDDSGPNNECDNNYQYYYNDQYYNNGCDNNDQYGNNDCDNNEQYDNNNCDNNDHYDNNGCDKNDQYYNNGCENNDQYGNNDCDNNDHYDNNGCDDNNQYCSEDNNYSEYVEDWSYTDEGTMYNPMQMGCGPSSDVPIENLKAYDTRRGSKTVDDAYVVDNYYDQKAS